MHDDMPDDENDSAYSSITSLLSDDDIRRIVKILGDVAGMTEPVQQRRKRLLEELCILIDADVWVWVHSRTDGMNVPSAFSFLSGGWRDQQEMGRFVEVANVPELNAPIVRYSLAKPHATVTRKTAFDTPELDALFESTIPRSGLADILISNYQLDANTTSGIGLHRRSGKPRYTDRETCLAHLILSQIDWLHRAETDVPANNETLIELTPRERQVLLLMLAGDGRKQIAGKLNLSVHTVGDHVKSLYRRFSVTGRGELTSLFITGGTKAG